MRECVSYVERRMCMSYVHAGFNPSMAARLILNTASLLEVSPKAFSAQSSLPSFSSSVAKGILSFGSSPSPWRILLFKSLRGAIDSAFTAFMILLVVRDFEDATLEGGSSLTNLMSSWACLATILYRIVTFPRMFVLSWLSVRDTASA